MTTDTKYTTLFIQVQACLAEKKLEEAIRLLQEGVDPQERSADYFLLLSRAVHAKGLIAQAVALLDEGIASAEGDTPLQHKRNEYFSQQRKLENALQQISDGQHSTPDINFMKSNTRQLIEAHCFEEAVGQLSALSMARKLKTTNILWIGNYLKDVYFMPEAEPFRNLYDDLLYEEMLFYFLKACKLFEPEYKIVQEAKKQLRASQEGDAG